MATRVDFTDKKIINQVGKWIKEGYTEASIATKLNYSIGHFIELKKRFPELAEVIKVNRENIHSMLKGKLYEMSMNDDHPKQFSAILFILKTQYGWSETRDTEDGTPKTTKFKIKAVS